MSIIRSAPPHIHEAHRWSGMRVGLLGGSFDPAHEGHVHISLAALNGLNLDYVWWLVTPQNPLKSRQPLSMDQRMRKSRELIDHPRILVSDLERQIGTNVTYYTIRALRRHFSQTDFVWISGMDNAQSLHTWNHWQRLLEEISMVHITRHPAKSLVRNSPNRMYTRQNHVFIENSGTYDLSAGHTYWMMQKKMVNVSSTEIRNKTLENQ